MKLLLQKVKFAKVSVEGKVVGQIGKGLLLFLGVGQEDVEDYLPKIGWLCQKVVKMRIFADDQGKMNRSVLDEQGSVLLVSQFTLYGDCQKGNRPSFGKAAPAKFAEEIYTAFGGKLQEYLPVEFGRFGANMQVDLLNDGPVTIWLER